MDNKFINKDVENYHEYKMENNQIDNNRVIIGYDDSPKDVYVMEEKPSEDDMKKSFVGIILLLISFILGRKGILFSIGALIVSFSVKKSSILNLIVRLIAIADIIVFIIFLFR
jgi:hypothetical protein